MNCIEYASDDGLRAIDSLIAYYRTNQTRMKYNEYIAQGLPIGSAIVESSHRHVLQVRMKRSGQNWSLSRARQMASLRAGYRTAGPRRFHRALLAATKHSRQIKPVIETRPRLIHSGLRNLIRASNR